MRTPSPSVVLPVVLCAVCAGVAGCESQMLISPASLRVALDDVAGDRSSAAPRSFPNYERIRSQVLGVSARFEDRSYADQPPPLPADLAQTNAMRKLVNAIDASIAGNEDRAQVKFSKDDLVGFADASVLLASRYFDTSPDDASGDRALGDVDFARTLRHYLLKYTKGEFINRSGGKVAKPQIDLTIGNDTIVGLTTVVLEAIYDFAFRTPVLVEQKVKTVKKEAWAPIDPPANMDPGEYFRKVYVEKRTIEISYFTKDNKAPTALSANPALQGSIVADGEIGITRDELKAIQFVSNLSGEQSKALSGILFRTFGDVQIAFGVGAHVSVGDNETLAKLLDTLTEVSSRRVAEAVAYEFFLAYPQRFQGDRSPGSMDLPEANRAAIESLLEEMRS